MYYFKISVVMVALFFGLTSCQENSLIPSDDDRSGRRSSLSVLKNANQSANGEENGESANDELCFEINYPVTIILPNGDKKEVNSDDELYDAIDEYYQANPDTEEDPTLEYPVTITKDGVQQTITSDDDLEQLFDDCFDGYDDYGDYGEGDCEDGDFDDYHMDCYELVYPVTVQIGDRTQVVNNEQELDALWDQIAQDTTAGDDYPEIQYPYDVTFEDGTTLTIDGEEALDQAYDKCYDGHDYKDCFSIKYPVQIQIPGGDVVTVSSDEEFFEQVDAYYQANPDAEDHPDFVYPVTVVYEDGTEKVANSEEELETLYEECDQSS